MQAEFAHKKQASRRKRRTRALGIVFAVIRLKFRRGKLRLTARQSYSMELVHECSNGLSS